MRRLERDQRLQRGGGGEVLVRGGDGLIERARPQQGGLLGIVRIIAICHGVSRDVANRKSLTVARGVAAARRSRRGMPGDERGQTSGPPATAGSINKCMHWFTVVWIS